MHLEFLRRGRRCPPRDRRNVTHPPDQTKNRNSGSEHTGVWLWWCNAVQPSWTHCTLSIPLHVTPDFLLDPHWYILLWGAILSYSTGPNVVDLKSTQRTRLEGLRQKLWRRPITWLQTNWNPECYTTGLSLLPEPSGPPALTAILYQTTIRMFACHLIGSPTSAGYLTMFHRHCSNVSRVFKK